MFSLREYRRRRKVERLMLLLAAAMNDRSGRAAHNARSERGTITVSLGGGAERYAPVSIPAK